MLAKIRFNFIFNNVYHRNWGVNAAGGTDSRAPSRPWAGVFEYCVGLNKSLL